MRWINFPDGSKYTLAVDIQNFAETHGYKVPCDADGKRHPGTDCNQKMRVVFKDAGMRRTFGVTDTSVVEVPVDAPRANAEFVERLVQYGIIKTYPRTATIHLYTEQAVNAILSKMLRAHVEYEADENDDYWNFPLLVTKRSHSLEKGKNKPKASLFKK